MAAGATVDVTLDVLAVDWEGVLSPSELSLSFSRLHARGLLSVSYPSSSSSLSLSLLSLSASKSKIFAKLRPTLGGSTKSFASSACVGEATGSPGRAEDDALHG